MPVKKKKQGGQQESGDCTAFKPTSGRETTPYPQKIPRPVAVIPLKGREDSQMLPQVGHGDSFAALIMDQGLSSDTASEGEKVATGKEDAKKDVSRGGKSARSQQPRGISTSSRDNCEAHCANETVRHLTAPVAPMFKAPSPVPGTSHSAVEMHQAWQANSPVNGRAFSNPSGHATYLTSTTDADESIPVLCADSVDILRLPVDTLTPNSAEVFKTNKPIAQTPGAIQPPQVPQPVKRPEVAKVANTSKARAATAFKRKANDTPTAAKTPASKRFASSTAVESPHPPSVFQASTAVESPRPPPVFEDESGTYYIADKLIDWRSAKARNGRIVVQVLVLWEGYPRQEATWEPMNVIRTDVGELKWKELADALWLCPGEDVEVIRKELLAYHRFRREQSARDGVVIGDSEDEATGNPFVDGDVDFF